LILAANYVAEGLYVVRIWAKDDGIRVRRK